MGDSISTGYGLEGYFSDPGNTASYPNVIKSRLGADLVNFAADGMTSGELLSLIESGAHDEDISGADLIFVSAGGNDLLREATGYLGKRGVFFSLASLTFERKLDEMIPVAESDGFAAAMENSVSVLCDNLSSVVSYIKSKNESCAVTVLAMYDPFTYDGARPIAEKIFNGANGKIKSACESSGALFADVHAAFSGSEKFLVLSGDIHPSKAGHEVIASLLTDICETEIKKAAS